MVDIKKSSQTGAKKYIYFQTFKNSVTDYLQLAMLNAIWINNKENKVIVNLQRG